MIEIKTLNKKELEDFITSKKYESYDFLPISRHRALSQIKNPDASEHDILLILAFENDRLAGYLGCVPDFLKTENQKIKYAWLSTIFVSEKFRGKKIAQQLLQKAFDSYQGQIALTEFTREAESLYNKTGQFQYIIPKKGKRYYFKFDLANLLPAKNAKYKKYKGLFSFIDHISNSCISLFNKTQSKPNFRYGILDKVDKESKHFLQNFPSHRYGEEINWILENPWILEKKDEDRRYQFSSFSEEFRYCWIKIYNDEHSIESCGLLLLRNGHLKIPYLFTNGKHRNFVIFLRFFIHKYNVKMLTSYQSSLNHEIETANILKFIYKRDFERRYMFHKNLIAILPKDFNPNFQDGDGDAMTT